jgi:hypothetical protein
MVTSFGLTAATPEASFSLFDQAFYSQGEDTRTTLFYPNGSEAQRVFSLDVFC